MKPMQLLTNGPDLLNSGRGLPQYRTLARLLHGLADQLCARVVMLLLGSLLLSGVGTGTAFAAETILPAASTNSTETHITSKTVDFDLKTRQAIYHGNVRVEDPRVNLSCEILTANIPEGGGRVDSIIAETNVVILLPDKGATNRATADRAVYTYSISGGITNEVLELQGSPAIETAQGTLKGDSIIWDRANDTIKATNQRMVVRQEEKDGDTNAIPELRSLKP